MHDSLCFFATFVLFHEHPMTIFHVYFIIVGLVKMICVKIAAKKNVKLNLDVKTEADSGHLCAHKGCRLTLKIHCIPAWAIS